MIRRIAALVALLLVAVPTVSAARVVVSAQVRYERQVGQSQYVRTDVTLMSAQELNTATRTYDYQFGSFYAVIFFGDGQAAVILLEGVFCGSEFEARCVPSFGNMRGRDTSGRRWEICTGSFCG